MELGVKKLIANARYPVTFYDSLSMYAVFSNDKVGTLYSYNGEKIIHGLIEHKDELDLIYTDSGEKPSRKHSVFGKEGKLIVEGYLEILFFPEAKIIVTRDSFSNPTHVFYDLTGTKIFSGPIVDSKSGVIDSLQVVNGEHKIFSCRDSLRDPILIFNQTGKIIHEETKAFHEIGNDTQERIEAFTKKDVHQRYKTSPYPFIIIKSPYDRIEETTYTILDVDGEVVMGNVSSWEIFPEQKSFILQDAISDLYKIFSLETGAPLSDKEYLSVKVEGDKLMGAPYEEIEV